MSKSNVTGHGTIKKLRTGAVVSVLTTSMLVGGVVSAEEVVTGTEYTLVEVVAESGASEEVVETKVTDAQVSEAKAEADKASQAVTEQEAVVGGLEETIATGESAVSDLNTQIEEANKVTPEVVADAKTDADAKSDALATANETVGTATNSANATSEAVATQEGVVSDADANAQKTASAVADAEKKVADLSGTTDTTQLQKDVDTLTETVAKDTTDLAEAKQALESAQLAETNKAQAITTQEGVVASKEADVDSTASALANATKAKSDAEKEVSTTKSALDTAKAGTTVTETVQVGTETKTTGGTSTLNSGVAQSGRFSGVNGVVTNADYLKAIQNYANGTGTIADIESALAKGISYQSGGSTVSVKVNVRDLLASPTVVEFQSWVENIRYSFSDTDNSTPVKVHDLTEEQLTDLSLFYASLVNELRSKLGTPLLDVTKSSVSVANDTTDALFNGLFANYQGMTHDQLVASGFFTKASGTINDVTVVAKGIANNENTTIINNIANGDEDATVSTMAELKSMVLAAVGHQLYRPLYNIVNGVGNSSDFSTALKVLGLVEGGSSVGVSLDVLSFKDGHGERVPKVVVTFSDTVGTPIVNKYSTVTGGTTTTTPIYETVTKTVVDESAVAAAQSAYDTALANAQTADLAYQNANTAYANAQQALADAQKQLSDLKSGTVDIPALEQAVKDAETQLEKDQASLQSAKETLAVAKASAIDKANALSKAKAELVEARSADENAQGVLAQEKETLEVLKKADQVAQLALTEAIAKQSTAKSDSEKATAKYNELAKALTDKGAVLTVLNAKLTEANQALAVARAEYETAKELLATLKADATKKTARYEELANLKAEQDRAEAEAKRLSELKAKAEAINNAGGIATPVVDANGVVIDYVDGKKATSVVHTKIGKQAGITQVGDKITYSRVERAKTLPNTGEQTSLLALAGVSVLSSLGLASARRRKQG
ncbi:SEC10/PgrA surface exclusion domain-containing protein [Streptococcus suis]|uniref:SEC10/PgrA surface exclusion domain-containing protein n=1 Tax=Streptococcus suis TaxID=1307 RepID=UPI0030CA0368